ncbi:hypothetical protein F5888DRAFT_1907481 [Russula emetica]|nr:hypothetical protein F5888DRAFT_1907481 [Russula emetica]
MNSKQRLVELLTIIPLIHPSWKLPLISQDISSAEQVSLHNLTVPELSPSDPTSNASSPSSSAPVTPLDPPPFAATQADPLGHGKHQPDPQPFRPVSKSASRLGTVWRARQVLLSLGKRKRRASAETSISTGVDSELLTDYYDVQELPDSNSAPEIIEPRLSQPQSLFSLPNVPIDSMPPIEREFTRRSSTNDTDTLPSVPSSPVAIERSPTPPGGAPWAPTGLSLSLVARIILFLPWCVAVGAAIALYPRALSPLVRMYAGPPRTPLHRLAHHAHTARAHLGIFLGVLCLIVTTIPNWYLRFVLLGAVVARAVVVWHGFGTRVLQERKGGEEEWREDARCVWRVLRGEEEREILRACGGEASMVKEE